MIGSAGTAVGIGYCENENDPGLTFCYIVVEFEANWQKNRNIRDTHCRMMDTISTVLVLTWLNLANKYFQNSTESMPTCNPFPSPSSPLVLSIFAETWSNHASGVRVRSHAVERRRSTLKPLSGNFFRGVEW